MSQQAGKTVVRITTKEPLKSVPPNFSVATPARIAFDFPNTANALGRSNQDIGQGDLRSMNVVQGADRTRLVLNLRRAVGHEATLEGNTLVITLAEAPVASTTPGGVAHFSEGKADVKHAVRDIDFRRGRAGEGRIVVDLADTTTGIDIRLQGQNIVVEFLKTALPESLRRRLDVVDFGTPVNTVSTFQQGENVRMVIEPKGQWEHNAYQSDTQFVLEVKPVVADPARAAAQRGRYTGERLSLNFQNVEVRAVLNVIADFTDLNIITSDTVTGNITLRLKDVPWDQALEIILQTRGLDSRRSGNVIWIAPRDELATREKLALEAQNQISDLEQTRTESFQMNYQKAADVQKLLSDPTQRILSKRGSAVVDARTNTLFVQDTPSRLEEVRRLIAKIDIAVRQVMIEARIVEANDAFSRNIGARLGLHDTQAGGHRVLGQNSPRFLAGGNLNDTGFHTGQSATTPIFPNESNSVNLPAAGLNAFAAGQVSLHPVQQRRDALPQPGADRARGRRQGQDHRQPARTDCGPGRGADRAGHGDSLPAGDVFRRDRGVVPQGQPGAQGQAADHAGRQRDDDARRQQGSAGSDHAGRRADQHQARQDRGPGGERRHGGDRRHLRAERAHRHHQDSAARRPAGDRLAVQEQHDDQQQNRASGVHHAPRGQ